MSNSLQEINLHLLTPGWIAPSPRRMRTCSTLHTTGVMSSLFNLVYTVCNPPTRCLRKSSKAWGRQINSRPSTTKAAILAFLYSISLHMLLSGLQAIGGGELYVVALWSLLSKLLLWFTVCIIPWVRLIVPGVGPGLVCARGGEIESPCFNWLSGESILKSTQQTFFSTQSFIVKVFPLYSFLQRFIKRNYLAQLHVTYQSMSFPIRPWYNYVRESMMWLYHTTQ